MPAPVSHDTRCSDCNLPWSMHAADEHGADEHGAVPSTECVRLLLVENERLRTSVPVGFPPQPWPLYVSNPYDQVHAAGGGLTAYQQRIMRDCGPMPMRPLEAPSGD